MSRLIMLVAAAVLAAAEPVAASPVLSFNEATGDNGVNQGQNVGWQFDVLSPVTVSGLGWFDEGGNGLGVAHTVGIWAPDGTLLASVVVPAGVIAPLDGQFRTAAIAPITLPVGNGYIVGGLNFSNSGDRLSANVAQTLIPQLRYFDATFSDFTNIFGRPTQFSTATTGFYGPSFSITAVPEPASLALFGLGGLAAGCLGWRRRKPVTA